MTPLKNVRRILVIRRDNIGDLVCTTPLISTLKKRFPLAAVEVLANSYNARILAGQPDVDRLWVYTKAKHQMGSRLRAIWREYKVYRQLRKACFDLVVHANPSDHPRTEKLVRYLKPRYSLGVSDADHTVYDFSMPSSQVRGPHHVQQVHGLLGLLGIDDEPGMLCLAGRREPKSLGPTPLLGIHISSRRPENRWPVERFSAVINQVLHLGWSVRVSWAPGASNDPLHPGDDDLVDQLRGLIEPDLLDNVDTLPRDSLDELHQGIAGVDMMLTLDGGALHMAAGLGRPVVALFGCTEPENWGPWLVPSVSLASHGDAGRLTVDQVMDSLFSLRDQLSTIS